MHRSESSPAHLRLNHTPGRKCRRFAVLASPHEAVMTMIMVFTIERLETHKYGGFPKQLCAIGHDRKQHKLQYLHATHDRNINTCHTERPNNKTVQLYQAKMPSAAHITQHMPQPNPYGGRAAGKFEQIRRGNWLSWAPDLLEVERRKLACTSEGRWPRPGPVQPNPAPFPQ